MMQKKKKSALSFFYILKKNNLVMLRVGECGSWLVTGKICHSAKSGSVAHRNGSQT
jgi:hypothetical protein